MIKLEKLHLENMQKELDFIDFNLTNKGIKAAKKSTEITENIAIEFAEWYKETIQSIAYIDSDYPRLYKKPTTELFQEFLKTKQ